MSLASRQPTIDSRALHRALQIVAAVIALSTVLLVMRAAPGPIVAEAGDPPHGEHGRQRHPEVFAPLAQDRSTGATLLAGDADTSDLQQFAQPAEPPAAAPTALPAKQLTAAPLIETFTGLAAIAPKVSSRAAARGAVAAEPPLPKAPPQVATAVPTMEESRPAEPSVIPAADEMVAAPWLAVSPPVAAAAAVREESRPAEPSVIPAAEEMVAAPWLAVSPAVAAAAPVVEQSLPRASARSPVGGETRVEQRLTAPPLALAEDWRAYEEFAPAEPAAPPTPAGTELEKPAVPPSLALVEDWQAYEEFPPTEPAPRVAETPADAVEIAAIEAIGKPVRFERLDARGEPLADGEPWTCVRDNRTGLVWEVKTRDGGLRDAAHVYSWFDPLQDADSGARDGGRCAGGIDCDTHDYQNALNDLALCGFSDWRLPARDELQTLVTAAAGRGAATIDDEHFPAALASWYWSASENDRRPEYAWYVLFRNGLPLNDLKSRPKHIRLVRGQRLLLASHQRHLDAD